MVAILFLSIFVALLIWAAASDVATMEIPNRISLLLVGIYPIAALACALPWQDILMHLAIGVAAFALCWGMFMLGVFGGGDAKVLAAATVWTGISPALSQMLLWTFIAGGGTSASTPGMAGIAALLNQKTGTAQGNLNPRLYQLAANTSAAAFHDVTIASSHVSGCTLAVPSLCNNSTPGRTGLTGGLAGFVVGNGYDEATGLGSVDATNLVTHWSAAGTSFDMNQAGLGGSWYDPSEAGQGIVMQVMPDFYGAGQGLLFGGWFTFDVTAAGGQRWYSVQGTVTSASSATMPIYMSEGGNLDAPPSVGVTTVGQATLAFSDCTHGTLTYAFSDGSGRNGTIALSRLGSNVACVPGGDSTPPGSYYLSGAWYDPATAGQGFVFDIDPVAHNLFAAWYTYAANGAQIGGPASERWYTLQSSFTPGSGHVSNVPIYQTTGGVFDQTSGVTSTQVGSATITYHTCNSATLTYTFNAGSNAGHSGSIDLARVAAAPSSCTL